MKKFISCLLLSGTLMGTAALGQEEGVTERGISEVSRGVFNTPLTVSPRVGALGFNNADNGYTSRITEGVMLNWSPTADYARFGAFNFGLETGLTFAHLGTPGSNFVGTSGPGNSANGANAFLIPLNLTGNYHITDQILVAVDAGAAAIYRSVSNQMLLGRTSDAGTGSSTEFFPEVGLSAGYALGSAVALSLRGDYIPVPSRDILSVSLGAVFALA